MTLKNRPKTKNYDQNYQKFLQNLVEKQSIGREVQTRAEQMVEDIPISIRQHYQPKHMAAASIVLASRLKNDPRTIKQMACSLQEMNGYTDQKNHINEVRRCMKKVRSYKNLDLDPVLAEDFLDVILNQIEAEEELKNACYDIMDKVKETHQFYGKSQIGVAAGIVYITSKKEKKVKDVAADKLSRIAARNRTTIRETAKHIQSEVPN